MIFPFFAALYKCYTAGYLQTKSGHQKKKKEFEFPIENLKLNLLSVKAAWESTESKQNY